MFERGGPGLETHLLYSEKVLFVLLSQVGISFLEIASRGCRILDRIDCVPCNWTAALARGFKVWDTRQIRSTEFRKHALRQKKE